MRRRAAIAAAGLALALGACGGDDEPPEPATRSPTPDRHSGRHAGGALVSDHREQPSAHKNG